MPIRKYVISDHRGGIVAGFNEEHEVVQVTQNDQHFKVFDTPDEAIEWADQHANIGYGLTTYDIKEVIGVTLPSNLPVNLEELQNKLHSYPPEKGEFIAKLVVSTLETVMLAIVIGKYDREAILLGVAQATEEIFPDKPLDYKKDGYDHVRVILEGLPL